MQLDESIALSLLVIRWLLRECSVPLRTVLFSATGARPRSRSAGHRGIVRFRSVTASRRFAVSPLLY